MTQKNLPKSRNFWRILTRNLQSAEKFSKVRRMKADNLVKLRDGLQMVVDAVQDELESQAPTITKSDLVADINSVPWKDAIGPRGPFQISSADPNNLCLSRLLTSLHEHGGRMTVEGYFVWVMNDGKSIGRKLKV